LECGDVKQLKKERPISWGLGAGGINKLSMAKARRESI